MVRKSILKRLSCIGSAVILVLAMVPIVPSGKVAAAPINHCVRDGSRSTLESYLNNYSEAALCSPINNSDQIRITKSVVIDLNNRNLASDLRVSGRNARVVIEATNGGRYTGSLSIGHNGGTFVIRGGTFNFNPSAYVDEGYEAVQNGRTWTVQRAVQTTLETSDATVPVNGVAGLLEITPADENYTYRVLDKNGRSADGAVVISSSSANGKTTGTVKGVIPGEYTVNITARGNNQATANVNVYSYNQIADTVLSKGSSQDLVVATTGAQVNWTASSSDTSVATVANGKINALAAGKTTITVRFADTLGTTFTFDVYVYDFDATDNLPLLIKKGESAVISTDSYWGANKPADDAIASVAEGENGKFTVTGETVGETEFTFATSVNGENLSKTIKVYVYDVAEDEIWIEKGETADFTGIELNSNDVTVNVTSSSSDVADIATSVYAIEGKSAGDATLTYKLMVDTRIVEIPVTVHVYSVNAKNSATIVAGTEVGLDDAAIAEIENTAAIKAVVVSGSEYATVDTYANGKLNTIAKGTAVIEFYAGEKLVGTTEVKVYELQDLQDIVLSITGTGANLSEVINKLEDINLPEYRINIADNGVASVREEGNWSWSWSGRVWHMTGHRITARGAGHTTATITYTDSLGETTETFDVLVSDYATRDVRGNHDVAQGGEVKFMISELYDQNSVTYADDLGFEISNDERGEYTVKVPADMAGGEYVLEFTDTVGGKQIAKQNVTIRVHEITVSEDELYIKKGEPATVTVKEKSGFGELCENVWHSDFLWWGHYEYECNVEVRDVSGAVSNGLTVNATEGSDDYEIVVNEAGEYTITFGDGVASKAITVYAIDFTVEKTEYHLVKGDNAPKLVKAINKYWNETNKGNTTGFMVTKDTDTDTDYYFWPTTAEAGKYTLTFYAKIGDKTVDEKTVDVYIYEMVKPVRHNYYGATGTVFDVRVGDKNSAARIETSIEGPAGGLVVMGNRVVALRPGTYTVTYTDYMADGGKVGEYVATFTVFSVEREVVMVARGESTKLTPHSDWSTDKATDRTSGHDLDIEDGKAVFTTTENTKLGIHNVVLGHDFGRGRREVVKEITVVVYSVEVDAETDPKGVTADTLREYIENMFSGSSSWEEFVEKMQKAQELFGEGFDAFWSVANVSGAVLGGDEITTRVEVTTLGEDEVDEVMIEAMNGLDVDAVEYYDVSVWMSRNGYDFGRMHQLNSKITVALAKVTDPETGYSRQYIVVRQHEGEEPEILVEDVDFYIKDGVLYVISDKFSTYAVAYKDTLIPTPVVTNTTYSVKAPETGEAAEVEGDASASLSVAVMVAIAAVTLAGAVAIAKRK